MEVQALFFDRIRQSMPSMSKSYRRVADYLLQHYQDAAFQTAAQVAAQAGVSESLVVRLAASLGYSGYPEMLREMQSLVKASLSPPERLSHRPVRLTARSPSLELLRAVIARDQQNLESVGRDPSMATFERVVEALLKARCIYVLGFRGLGSLAGLLGFLLETAGAQVRVITSGDAHLFEQLRRISPDDVLFAISFARYTRRTIEALEAAKRRGATTIALTDSLMSPAAQQAALTLRAEVASYSFHNSYTAAVGLINALVVAWSIKAEARTMASLRELEQILPQEDFL